MTRASSSAAIRSRSFSRRAAAAGLLLALAASANAQPDIARDITLRDELNGYHLAVTTRSPEAQRWFDQGIALYYGFHHEAAIASFQRAAALDSTCAMAWWGVAISAGPHINNPQMDEAAVKLAWETLQRAQRLAPKHANPLERALIGALSARYAFPAPESRSALDQAYAGAMREVWRANPENADVGTLFADAMMNLRPWDLWSAEGEPRPETPEIVATLERVMEMVPDHPGACHFYIHAVEASRDPGRALPAADRLRARIPGAGHLVHMPSHIDIRLGRYAEAAEANERGIAADRRWEPYGGFYTIYRAHNFHFLAYAAMFQGRRDAATEAARGLVSAVPAEMVEALPSYVESFLGVPYHVMVRFGQWNEILSQPPPGEGLPSTTAFWRYARTVALAALGRVEEGAAELAELRKACEAVPEEWLLGNNPTRVVLDIGLAAAEGELEYRRGRFDRAFELLRLAVERDDALRYDEPWGWMMPVRHALGALLLEQGRLADAEAVYRADLERHPGNGWALHGLAECLRRGGRAAEAADADARFRAAWGLADTAIKGSCFCRTKG